MSNVMAVSGDRTSLPSELDPNRVRRRVAQVVVALAVLVLVALLAPGLDEVRERLRGASAGWLAAAVVLEALSGVSYVLMFRPIFCDRMSWRTSWEIGWAELGVGSLVPASGAGGLALGAWVLRQGGMPGEHIARRSVAFYLIKSSVNFIAVAVVGAVLAFGLVENDLSLWLTALPAAMATAVLAAVVLVATRARVREVPPSAGRVRRGLGAVQRALVRGAAEAVEIVRSRNLLVLFGALGYWAFDNAVLWATFEAVGVSPGLDIILLGYLIGQLGGLLPLPGGVGGIDGGLIGTLIVYGAPAAATVAAVLAYRLILFWLPLLPGAIGFVLLRRGLNDPDRPDLCELPAGA